MKWQNGDDDEVQETPWCLVCRRSSDLKWKKHVFTTRHQTAALRFLRARAAELAKFCEAKPTTSSDSGQGGGGRERRWRCRFCEHEDAPAGQKPTEERDDRRAGVDHFASAEHRRRVEQFCRKHKCDHEQKERAQLWLAPEQQRQLVAALEEEEKVEADTVREAERAATEVQRAWKAGAFLSAAVARLQEVRAEQQAPPADPTELKPPTAVSTFGSLTVIPTTRIKTVTSGAGILQNPLGRHNGERVWGGGIVKLKSSERVPWGIDELVKQEQARRTGTVAAPDEGDDAGESFKHRMTDVAYGGGLGSVARVDWAPQVGNMHSGAVPPWMVASEDEYKRQNTVQGRANEDTARDKDWLPNFGGVWESGPRSKTRLAFQQTARQQRKRVAPQPFDRQLGLVNEAPGCDLPALPSPQLPSEGSDVRTEEATASALPLEATASLEEAIEPARQVQKSPVPPAEPTPSAPSTAVPGTASAALDPKKQQLLVQKERLRAKFAARRQAAG